jgi:hypothetical protein
MRQKAAEAGRRFATGPEAFGWLAERPAEKLAENHHDGNGNCKRSLGTIGN